MRTRPSAAIVPSNPRHSTSRITRLIALALLLSGTLGAGSRPPVTPSARPGVRAASNDPVTVYGPATLVHTSSNSNSWALADANFTADLVPGWRYYVNINATASVVYGAIAAVNDTQWVGSSQFGGAVTALSQPVRVVPGDNVLTMYVRGTTNSAITYTVTRVKDPTFWILPDTTFVRPGTIATQRATFVVPAGGGAPYSLHLRNGTPNGGSRLTSASDSVNKIGVMSNADFGTGVAYQERNVNLHAVGVPDTLTLYN